MGVKQPYSTHDNILTQARLAKNLTLYQAAEKVGCSWWTVQRYEDIGYVQNLDFARAMSKLYDIPMAQLLGVEVLEGRK